MFWIRFAIRNGQESAEKCWEVLRTVPPLSVPLLPLCKQGSEEIPRSENADTKLIDLQIMGLFLRGRTRTMVCEGQKVPQSPKPRKNQSNEKVTKK